MEYTGHGQRLAAILVADAAGYSRLMAADESATVAALDAARALFRSHIESRGGRVVDMAGDSVLAVFQTALGAVSAALAIQQDLAASRAAVPADRQMCFRIGVHLGDVIEKDDGTVYGDGVNIAARLQAMAEVGGITVSDAVHGAVRGKVSASFVDRGEQTVKNIAHPVRSFALQPAGGAATPAAPPALVPVGGDPSLPAELSIAVLPFTNLSGDPQQDYFADGMVEDIITALARMRVFFVIARNSSFVYKGQAVDIKQVGRALGVRYVLEGSVRRSGNRLRITGQLIEAESGRHVWAERFEGEMEDVFDLQDRIGESIVSAMEPSMRRADVERARAKPTSSLQAYDLLLRALPGLMPGADRAGNDEALALIRRALERDPHYANAMALGALACVGRVAGGHGSADDIKAGLGYAEQSLAASNDDPLVLSNAGLALASLGYRALGVRVLGFRYDEAQRAVERALKLAPGLLAVQYAAGMVRLILGEGKAALDHLGRAMRISPLDPAASALIAGISAAHLVCGRYEAALADARRAIQDSPNFGFAHLLQVAALGRLGRSDEARAATRRLVELAPGFTVSRYLSLSPVKDAEYRKATARIYRAAGVPK